MATEGVISIEEIEKQSDLPVFEVSDALDWMEGPSVVGDNTLESLAGFSNAVGAKVLLVQYDYPDLTEYFVDPDDFDLDELFEDGVDDVEAAIDERNAELDGILAEYDGRPWAVSVFVMYEGQPFGVFLTDNDLIDRLGETSMEFIARLYWQANCDCEED